jgi:arylformamidase
LLIKTRNSLRGYTRTFDREYQALSAETLTKLREKGYVSVGIDYLSATPYRDGWAPHAAWLTGSKNIFIEGLDLREIFPNIYYLMCLPLSLPGLDAAPARVMLGAAGGLDKKT